MARRWPWATTATPPMITNRTSRSVRASRRLRRSNSLNVSCDALDRTQLLVEQVRSLKPLAHREIEDLAASSGGSGVEIADRVVRSRTLVTRFHTQMVAVVVGPAVPSGRVGISYGTWHRELTFSAPRVRWGLERSPRAYRCASRYRLASRHRATLRCCEYKTSTWSASGPVDLHGHGSCRSPRYRADAGPTRVCGSRRDRDPGGRLCTLSRGRRGPALPLVLRTRRPFEERGSGQRAVVAFVEDEGGAAAGGGG